MKKNLEIMTMMIKEGRLTAIVQMADPQMLAVAV